MIDLEPNRIFFVYISIRKWWIQSDFDLIQQDYEKISLSAGVCAFFFFANLTKILLNISEPQQEIREKHDRIIKRLHNLFSAFNWSTIGLFWQLATWYFQQQNTKRIIFQSSASTTAVREGSISRHLEGPTKDPLKPLKHHYNMVPRGLRRAHSWRSTREHFKTNLGSVCGTAQCSNLYYEPSKIYFSVGGREGMGK